MKKHAKKIVTILLVAALLVPTIVMIGSNAAIVDYPVELAFNNIFVFDKWASNKLSTTIVSNGAPVNDKLDINIEDGSFHFNNPHSGEAYTGHGMGQGAVDSAGNFQYYMMDIESGASYTFSYNLTNLTSGLAFTPYVFYFDESGSYLSHVSQSFTGSGDTEFVFSVPSKAKYIQVRFTISGTGSADVKKIAISKADISFGNNIFDFDSWANNSNSGKVSTDTNYNGGTISKNTTDNSVTLSTNGAADTLFTNFTLGNGNGYYMMPVEANTQYSFSYNLASLNFKPNYYTPYVAYYGANSAFISYDNSPATNAGTNRFDFVTPANAAYIQIVYGIVGIAEAGKTCTVKDVAVQKLTVSSGTSTDVPHRIVYEYKGDGTTYGELPVPANVPNGYVFAGWYTGVNGTGELITENTPIDFESYTVYPKYEPIVNSISIKTMPVKTSYTVGERVNPTGLVLEATVGNLTRTIESGYRCTPEYLTATGTQTVTVHYGGKTTTYTVEVSASTPKSVVVNGSTIRVGVTNNVYTFTDAVNTGEFNRYVITYNADAYFEGIITYSDDTTEQFFLEPSSNFGEGETPKFTSFIDGYLEKVIDGAGKTTAVNSHTRNGIKSIKFTPLDNKSGSIDLLSITTSKAQQITNAKDTLQYFSDSQFKVGVDILNGGVVSELYALNSNVVARVYEHKDPEGNVTYETLVDYAINLPSGYKSESKEVNLINTYDTGRYLQQSYYGTSEKPYETSYYNRADWNYNPVQGGNVANEASKVIDYEIGDDYIYIKARPLDWAKWSDDHAEDGCLHSKDNPDEAHTEARWGDEYITDTYVEAKYVFEDGVIKTYCRMVDYSGYPSAQTTQELPAFYTIEPLNNFVYNDVTEDEAWVIQNLKYDESPEFWGISQDYKNYHYPNGGFDANVDVAEHWAAFMASESSNSFGIGLYTPETTNFYYGVYPQKYSENISNGVFTQTNTLNYRHAETINPATEDDSSYIAPIGVRTFESFKPTEYMYSLTTGTVNDIQDTFGLIYDERYESELSRAQIAVPETIYMTPSAGQSTTGQYFVNNSLDANGNLTADAKNNATQGIISVYAPGSTAIKFDVSAIKGGIGDPVIGGGSVDSSYENTRWDHSLIYEVYGTGAATDWFVFDQLGLAINGTGVSAGGTALLEWKVIIYYGDDDTTGKTHYAYTTLYSPWLDPVGSAIRSYTRGKEVYDQAAAWVSGVHGYTANGSGTYWVAATNQTLNNDGSFVGNYYARTNNHALVPLLYGIGNPGNTKTGVVNFLTTSPPGGGITSPTFRYTDRRSSSGDFGILVSEISPVANITVDTSRYTNFNQIPNLTVGYNITDIENSKGVIWYVSDLTDIVNSATDATSHEVKFYNHTYSDSSNDTANHSENEWFDGKAVGNIIYGSATENCGSSYNAVSSGAEHNAAWDRGIVTGSATYDYMFKGAAHAHYNSDARAYTMNHVQLRAANVNKANLRDLIALASALDESNYTTDSWSAFKKALQDAAIELGNPTDSDISAATEELKSKMNALQTPVTLHANGGSFSGGATTTTVNLTCGPRLTPSYTIPEEYNPTRNGYAVEGWSTDANATEGTNPVIGGLKPTFYAIWTEGSYTIVYDANGGAGYIAGVTVKHSESVELATIGFSRDGYSMVGWSTNASATAAEYLPGQTVSGLSNTTGATVTLYAVWLESKYTVIYDANGGSGSIPSKTVNISESFALASSGFTKAGCTLLGWATNASALTPEYQLGQTVSRLAAAGSITLYAVWEIRDVNITFDNLIDFNAWNKVAGNGVVSDVTNTGFTITCNDGQDEATSSSPYFAVTPGKNYKIDIDITDINAKGWDVYIFFCDANGKWIDFVDGETNRYSGTTTWDSVFTAPDKTEVVKAQIRVDANNAGGKVNFNNIRVYEYDGIDIDVTPANKIVNYKKTFGNLPTPTRYGFDFVGWFDGNTQITAETPVTQSSTVHLKSKWVVNNDSLVSDRVVVDFGVPVEIAPISNDTIFMNEVKATSGSYELIGLSTDGSDFSKSLNSEYGSLSVNGNNVTYNPAKPAGGTEVVYYQASLTANGRTTPVEGEITIVPASNILYEENSFITNETSTGSDWETVKNDPVTANGNQSVSSKDDVYGYDASYNNFEAYSNDSALKVNVDSTNKRSKIISFDFTGTGFDLNGVCGPDTGVQVVTLKDNTNNKMVKSYVVDTYYGDAKYGTLYQVPVISENGLAYGDYSIQIVASYLPSMSGALNANVETQAVDGIDGMTVNTAAVAESATLREALAEVGLEYVLDAEAVDVIWFDDNSVLNGGMGVDTLEEDTLQTASVTSLLNVVDSVRVYNPIENGDSYYISSEQNAEYYNVMDNLVNNTANGIISNEGFFAYVSGKDEEEISVDIYNSTGPKDELYLAKVTETPKAVTFKINGFDKNAGNVMISLRAASGTPTVKIGSYQFAVNSNTEMYYDITGYIADDGTVTIQNAATADSLLAVGSLKITSETLSTASLSTEFNLMTARAMMLSVAQDVVPNAPDTEPEIPADPVDPADPEEPSEDDNSSECWLVRLFKWIIEMFTKLVDIIKSFFAW